MNAVELFNSKGESTGIWCCGKCKKLTLSPLWNYGRPDNEKNTRESAESCCRTPTCETCGSEFGRYDNGSECQKCRDLRWDRERKEKYLKRLEAATDVTAEYAGPILCEEYQGGGDWGDYFSSVGAFLDWAENHSEFYTEDGDLVIPGEIWVFACYSRVSALNLSDVLENLCDDGYEDMIDHLDVPQSLKDAFDEFNKKNEQALTQWEVDYSKKVLITLPVKTQ